MEKGRHIAVVASENLRTDTWEGRVGSEVKKYKHIVFSFY